MNLIYKCTPKEIELIEKAGVQIENKDYTEDELTRVERDITEFIMNHSTKDDSIPKLQSEYQKIYRILGIR